MITPQSYIYTGKKTAVTIPKSESSSFLIDSATFIINVARPLKKKKSCGSVCFYKHKGSQLIELQLDCIYRICKYPQIVFVTGIDINKLVKHKRRSEFSIVENKIYDLTNNAEELRLGVNAAIHKQLFWIDGRLIPTIKTFKQIFSNANQSTCLTWQKDTDDLGVVCNSNKIITDYMYSSAYKTKGLYYLNTTDTSRIKNKFAITINKNTFDYEVMKEFNILSVEDKSSSYLLEE